MSFAWTISCCSGSVPSALYRALRHVTDSAMRKPCVLETLGPRHASLLVPLSLLASFYVIAGRGPELPKHLRHDQGQHRWYCEAWPGKGPGVSMRSTKQQRAFFRSRWNAPTLAGQLQPMASAQRHNYQGALPTAFLRRFGSTQTHKDAKSLSHSGLQVQRLRQTSPSRKASRAEKDFRKLPILVPQHGPGFGRGSFGAFTAFYFNF